MSYTQAGIGIPIDNVDCKPEVIKRDEVTSY